MQYAVTYVPVLVNMAAGSPDEQNMQYAMTYVPALVDVTASSTDDQNMNHHSASLHAVPPQEHSIYPTGLNASNPGPTPEEFYSAYAAGIPCSTDQTMYNPSSYSMVSPLQPAPAKRKMKAIRVRDPNQGMKDITEEIILEVGRIRNLFQQVEQPSSIYTPLQQYALTYGPALLDVTASSTDDQNMNHHSASLHAVPLQEHSVYPTGLNAFNPGPTPEEFYSAYAAGIPCSTDQTMFNQLSYSMVSPLQPAPAKRKMKAMRVRDPNQGMKDLTEEIILEVGRIQNTFQQVEQPSSIYTPPQPNQVVEQEHVIYNVDKAQVLPASPHWKPDDRPTLEGYALKCTALDAAERPISLLDKSLEAIDGPSETDAAPRHNNSKLLRENEPKHSCKNESNDGVLTPAEGPNSATVAQLENWSKQYSRDFILSLQFKPASMQKPEGLPPVKDVILDKVKPEPVEENEKQEAEFVKKEPKHSCENESINGVLTPAEGPNSATVAQLENRRIQYSKDFILSLQFKPASMQKPEGLPPVKDIILDKELTASLRQPLPCKIFRIVPMNEEVELKKAENAWKPCMKRRNSTEDPETQKTEELFRTVRSILNKLTPEMFNQLMKQLKELHIDTEERLKGVVNLIFEKAIDEPNFSMGYGIMCKSLAAIDVPMANKPHSNVNFRTLLLHRCQKEFDKDKTSNDVLDKKQQELEAAVSASERERLQDELEEAKNQACRKTKGNMKFIGQLFKLRMLTESIIHNCVVKLLKRNDEGSLECLSILLTTAGKEIDLEMGKSRMDQYIKQIEKIINERKTSSRIRFMLQDVIDLRLNNWVSKKAEKGPKTIEQIHKDAQFEELEEQLKVHKQLKSKGKRRPVILKDSTVLAPAKKDTIDPNKIPKMNKLANNDAIYLGSNWDRRGQRNWKKGCNGGNGDKASIPVKLNTVEDSTTNKPALSEEEMEKQSKSIIEEYLHANDYKEALHCVKELDQGRMLYLFVRVGVETTLERKQITRDQMGHLFHRLLQAGILSASQFFKGFSETLEVAEDLATDIPYIWRYIAELVHPVLQEGGISLRELFCEFNKPLLTVARAGILFSEILHLLCKQMSQKEVGDLWRDSKLNWADFLPETVDVNNFIMKQKLDFTISDCS
ncbi:eukaryotic translation initiation factor 4 gamma 3-like isoform X3 [Silurus meridionalis]|uniref:eukaryotic translation initiation factor 4 gamma 3-like isoform X3 n=1 Tax=Silurus meridionalis TaxID=175797 RepID=UPI001EEA62B7|nr:eukaryotic translation initiation factor 4 gamma 3-like isoform X3 [Silurus meridionalis]